MNANEEEDNPKDTTKFNLTQAEKRKKTYFFGFF